MPSSRCSVAHQVEHRALDRHVERGRDLVGDHDLGTGGERPGERDPLPLTAGQLPGIRAGAARRRVRRGRAAGRPRRVGSPREPRGIASAMLAPIVIARVERRVRVLEDHLQRGDGVPSAARGRPSSTISPADSGASPTAARARVDLPEPDSPTRPTTSPSGTVRLTPSTAERPCRRLPKRTETSSKRSSATAGRTLHERDRSSGRRERLAGVPARDPVPAASDSQRRVLGAAPLVGERAARRVGAAGRHLRRVDGAGPGMTASGRSRSVCMSGTARDQRTRVRMPGGG